MPREVAASPDDMRILIDSATLTARVSELALQLHSAIGPGTSVHFVGVLTGAFVFLADLMRAYPGPSSCDFIAVSSYRYGAESAGAITLVRDLAEDITGRHVVIVEDIIDTGWTLSYLRARLLARGPASLRTVALLSKPARRQVDVPVELIGFEISDHFVVGYGLDLAGRYRNLPYIGVGPPGAAS